MSRVAGFAAALWMSACANDPERPFGQVVDRQTLEVSEVESTVTLGRGAQQVELVVPANALPTRGQIRVSAVSNPVQRGRHPATDTALFVEPAGTAFVVPLRLRQLVPAAAPGRRYRTVVVPDHDTSFVVRGPARLIRPASPESQGQEQWEADVTSSGLWGLSLEQPADEGAVVADAGDPDAATADAAVSRLACTPATFAGCAAAQTCVLSCLASGDPVTSCAPAGTKQPGDLCAGDAECAPGSQCYRKVCGVSVCRKHCGLDADCPSGGRCAAQLSCSKPLEDMGRLCTDGCDPRGTATTGCAQGLRCFVFPGEVTDCECVSPERVGGDGSPCSNSGVCGPGFLCVTTGSPTCRPVCRLDAPTTCGAGRTCQRLTSPNYEVFGACVP